MLLCLLSSNQERSVHSLLQPISLRVRLGPHSSRDVPAEVRFVLGDRHYHTDDLHENYAQTDWLLATTKYGGYPPTDDGVEV